MYAELFRNSMTRRAGWHIPTRRVIRRAGKLKKWGLQQIDTKIVFKLKFEEVSCVQISIWVHFRKELDLKYRFAGRNSRSIGFSSTESANKDCHRKPKKMTKSENFWKSKFSIFLVNFLLKASQNRKKAKKFGRERPARWALAGRLSKVSQKWKKRWNFEKNCFLSIFWLEIENDSWFHFLKFFFEKASDS